MVATTTCKINNCHMHHVMSFGAGLSMDQCEMEPGTRYENRLPKIDHED